MKIFDQRLYQKLVYIHMIGTFYTNLKCYTYEFPICKKLNEVLRRSSWGIQRTYLNFMLDYAGFNLSK